MAMDGFKSTTDKNEENEAVALEKLSSSTRKSHTLDKDLTLGQKIASWKAEVSDEIKMIKERYERLEQELDMNNHHLEASKERICGLEKESQLLLEERDDLLLTVSDSLKRVASLTQQNEKVLQDLSSEIQRRKDVETQIKQFSIAFASRQRSLMSFHSEFKSKLDHLKVQSPVLLTRSIGC